ncbi:hypothetical protein M0E87_03885 [Corynebacterium sp. CCM 9185]|uniref:Uncharacterized protein n=1 Tax=Corynebacterium marambiense TaxID=2765364 RepID=A0ABS0VVW4_9CORY|nr:hypothetical protein [Corynebacterium marambiense]MBI9000926.1 hypothetical protein [Corynebacterium marambiense]MCK7662803.1 hypothetical protein [Corynebacterium marambiense]MCX7542412.1 hypothetical protein [Corynebacterium marambiense]
MTISNSTAIDRPAHLVPSPTMVSLLDPDHDRDPQLPAGAASRQPAAPFLERCSTRRSL